MSVRSRWITAVVLLIAVPVWAQANQPKPADKPAAEKAPADKTPPAPAKTEKPADKPAAPAATASTGAPTIGKPAPDFALMDIDGKETKLSSFKGKVVVLEWVNHECPVCNRHIKGKTASNVMAKFKDKPVVWLGVDSSNFCETKKESIKKWHKDNGLTFPILLDAPGKVGKSYGAKTTPHVFVIDQTGNLAYQGAMDDDAEGNKEKKKNYVEEAINALLSGSTVATTTTQPYGCNVKY
ncbi:MAG: redoxin domain-containing protein [Planctomycetes bacterium]|nr:redoxin domain-containing protein [Planctomycetota bacterium]